MTTPMFDQWRARSPYYDDTHEAVCDTVRAFVAIELPSQKKSDHSVLTEQPQQVGIDKVLDFFDAKLK